jgi:4-diphosphocytidyl-2-C-methyl-D-erythritol kinase
MSQPRVSPGAAGLGRVEIVAPAKINLFLHVGPKRPDGLHELASLFVFAGDGDRLAAVEAPDLSLSIVGPEAGALLDVPSTDNLVLRAAQALRRDCRTGKGAALTLDKRLPVASGVGGGSADAAAALRALVRLWEVDIAETELRRIAFELGADVPACLAPHAVLVSGAGERTSPAPRLPQLWVCLVNPRIAVSTGAVFAAFDDRNPRPAAPEMPEFDGIFDYDALISRLKETRNDLEPHSIARAPQIGEARRFLASREGCLFARMSGSGATVYGLFASLAAAERAARAASGRGLWSMAAALV